MRRINGRIVVDLWIHTRTHGHVMKEVKIFRPFLAPFIAKVFYYISKVNSEYIVDLHI